MTVPDRYVTATAFRRALETRLKAIANDEHTDLQRLRKQIAFDRFLCRLFAHAPDAWVLKGGYAMELRIRNARTTKDIDLTFRKRLGDGFDSILEYLQDAARLDLADGFDYIVGTAMTDLEGAPYGGARYPVEARMDGRTFSRFHLDAGAGDAVIEPVESISPRAWLDFAGVPATAFPVLSAEQQFAEKYHAYTMPRGDRENSRVRDLVDMLLLIRHAKLLPQKLAEALQTTFKRRATHDIPETVPNPPEFWTDPFRQMAAACGLETSLPDAPRQLSVIITASLK